MTMPRAQNTRAALANVIIAGAGRSGTTSLFRYLAEHPSVCASSAKEVHFFDNLPPEGLAPERLERYASYFRHCSLDCPVRIEATAGYLYGGRRTAEAIRAVMPDVKLIFLLREPISRAFTVFRKSRTGEPEIFQGLTFDEFVEIGLEGEGANGGARTNGRADMIAERLMHGCYAPFLAEFFSIFSAEQICVQFFEEFAKNTRSVVGNVTKFLDIDQHFFDSYQFHVENKTRTYRFSLLHRFADVANVKCERVLNRYPALRRSLREIYNRINERRDEEEQLSEFACRRLGRFYEPYNRDLRALLEGKVASSRWPAWIAAAK